MKPQTTAAQIAGFSCITIGCLLLAIGLIRQGHHHSSSAWMLAAVLVEVVGVVLTATQLGRRR